MPKGEIVEPRPYDELGQSELLALCCWREARGEPLEGKLAQCWSVKNRVQKPGWWGRDWHSVILKPFQYSAFNANDPNATKWPVEGPDWEQCQHVAETVMNEEIPDPTDGATHYFDTSISFPKSWGNEAEWVNTLNVGRLRFWKVKPREDLSAEEDV